MSRHPVLFPDHILNDPEHKKRIKEIFGDTSLEEVQSHFNEAVLQLKVIIDPKRRG